ncbi:MAG: hypothetical protein ABI603_05190 [Acidobacteriota bacterium]
MSATDRQTGEAAVQASRPDAAAAAPPRRLAPGLLLVTILLALYGGLALTVDFPHASMGIQSDEATYYMMGHSLALDGDLAYRRQDLVRVWREFPSGPAGLFLKRGRRIVEAGMMRRPPFVWTRTAPDPDQQRFFYGKAFIYPLCAAPFVALFGTNGFLVLHALLLALVAWCGYLFLHARTPATLAAALSGAFIMASVVPVYFVWITPELFNFALGLLAYFCWLYKEVEQPSRAPFGTRWLFGSGGDLAAAALLGVATFSKISNALLVLPIVAWIFWRRRWGRGIAAGLVFGACAAGLFAANMAISGEWNYQGGARSTFVWEFPFQTAASTFDVGLPMGRDESLAGVILDRRVFWTNLTHNLRYYFVGRHAGIVPYFFPAVFALAAFLLAPRRRPGWQYLVLAAGMTQMLFFIINLPYTWLGGGGSVGNRYFMGAYGIFLFLLPPLRRTWVAAMPWLVGGLFTAQLVLNPFATSVHPGDAAKHGPLRWLPVELTMVNDLPVNTEGAAKVLVWFGDNPGQGDPGFQIYFLDDNAYGREPDKSFWVKGESKAEFLIKYAPTSPDAVAGGRPLKQLVLTLSPGPFDTVVKVSVSGRTREIDLKETQQVAFTLDRGFWYQARAYVWVVSISSSTGFVPIFNGADRDARFLGVRVKPTLVP